MEYVDTEGNVQVLTETFLAGNAKRHLIDVNKGGKPYIITIKSKALDFSLHIICFINPKPYFL